MRKKYFLEVDPFRLQRYSRALIGSMARDPKAEGEGRGAGGLIYLTIRPTAAFLLSSASTSSSSPSWDRCMDIDGTAGQSKHQSTFQKAREQINFMAWQLNRGPFLTFPLAQFERNWRHFAKCDGCYLAQHANDQLWGQTADGQNDVYSQTFTSSADERVVQ